MQLIEAHERSWGTDQYPARPSLADLLHRSVVVFWSGDDKAGKGRFTVSVHDHVEELNELLLAMVVQGKVTPSANRKLARIFVQQKPVAIKGIQLIVDR